MNRQFHRLLLLPILFVFSTAVLSAQTSTCQYTIIMNDVYGDGWNGGVLTVTSGTQSTPFSLATGLADTMTFDVLDGEPLMFSWVQGSFLYEVSYTILDNTGGVVSQVLAPNMPPTGLLYSGTGMCITCAAPLNFRVTDVADTNVKLAWAKNANSPNPPEQFRLIYGLQGFDIAAGDGDTLTTTNTKMTIGGLQKKTWYDVYIEQDCGMAGGISHLVGPISFETYWSIDVGVSGVVSPVSSCELGNDTVRILLTNYGGKPQSLIPMRFTVNGEDAGVPKPQDGVYTNVLGKDSVEVFVFETTFDFSEPGEYVIVAYTKLTGDEDVSNDTFTYYLNNRLLSPYTQQFEVWDGGWTVTADGAAPSFEFGVPNKPSIPSAASGMNAWVTSLTDSYNSDEISYLESPCFDFTILTVDPVISFSITHDLESEYDAAWLELSVDGGNTWTKIGEIGEGINWYNEDITMDMSTQAGESWSGNSGGWVTARHFLDGAAGFENVHYRFAVASDVTFELGGLGIDDVRIFPAFNKDLSGIKLAIPSDGMPCGLEEETVSFTFVNVGAQLQTDFKLAYSVNGGTPVVETYSGTIVPDEVKTYTFNTTFDSRDSLSHIQCWAMLFNDFAPANDTVKFTIDHRPLPTPFHEDFEDMMVPQGWTTNGAVTNDHGNSSYVLAENVYSFNPSSIHDLPRYGLIKAGDTLSFDYRLTNFSNGGPTILALGTKVEIQVSSDCGETYQTIYAINSLSHTPTTQYRKLRLGLDQFDGQSILIRFATTWSSGDFWLDLDNINLLSCAADMALTADITNASPGQNNGTAIIQVGLGNPPYTYLWSNGNTTDRDTSLVTGTYTVTVVDALGCSGAFEFVIGTSATKDITGLSSVTLFPNPTDGQVFLQAEFDRRVQDVQIQVLNTIGKLIWESHSGNTDWVSENINLSQMPEGLYLVRLFVDGQVLTRKLVLAKG